MSLVALIVLGCVVAAVAIDLAARRGRKPPDPPDNPPTLTVDLTRR